MTHDSLIRSMHVSRDVIRQMRAAGYREDSPAIVDAKETIVQCWLQLDQADDDDDDGTADALPVGDDVADALPA